jgi:uncharacterized protein (TIGR02646 family)
MHKLERDPRGPNCLRRYQHGLAQWNSATPTPDEKVAIWEKLDAMQGRRCAYCEAGISDGARHIEHFRPRGRYPQGTFDWTNLFGSCNRQESCGKHKDDRKKCGDYNPDDLIKPDVDDPEDFFLFVSDGTIAIRDGLSDAARRRAEETLRVFNLDAQHGPLRHMRKQAVVGHIQTGEELMALAAEYPEPEWRPFLESELAKTADLAFATAIKHTLCPLR